MPGFHDSVAILPLPFRCSVLPFRWAIVTFHCTVAVVFERTVDRWHVVISELVVSSNNIESCQDCWKYHIK